MPVDPHRAFRQLQRQLAIDDQGRHYHSPSAIRKDDCEVIGTIVYDRKTREIRYEPRPDKASTKPDSD